MAGCATTSSKPTRSEFEDIPVPSGLTYLPDKFIAEGYYWGRSLSCFELRSITCAHASALHWICSITRRTRLIQSQARRRPRSRSPDREEAVSQRSAKERRERDTDEKAGPGRPPA